MNDNSKFGVWVCDFPPALWGPNFWLDIQEQAEEQWFLGALLCGCPNRFG